MEENFYTEDELVQMYQDGTINIKEFISMHSEKWQDSYLEFCEKRGLDIDDEQSSWEFLDMLSATLEEAMRENEA